MSGRSRAGRAALVGEWLDATHVEDVQIRFRVSRSRSRGTEQDQCHCIRIALCLLQELGELRIHAWIIGAASAVKNAVRSDTRAACCMLWVTITIV